MTGIILQDCGIFVADDFNMFMVDSGDDMRLFWPKPTDQMDDVKLVNFLI